MSCTNIAKPKKNCFEEEDTNVGIFGCSAHLLKVSTKHQSEHVGGMCTPYTFVW